MLSCLVYLLVFSHVTLIKKDLWHFCLPHILRK
uniref:Uncharacterized protein n=1 Tax=Arundo donax TaxID=35708 RepID=A0A0A9H350_ARUDO